MMRLFGTTGILTVFVICACSNIRPFEDFDTAVSKTPSGITIVSASLPEEVGWVPDNSPGHAGSIFPLDVETLIDISDTIVRVRLLEVAPYIAVTTSEHSYGDTLYSPYMGFKFNALEYLKGGNGHSNIWGMVKLDQADTIYEEDALAAYNFYLKYRDTSWDSREAVVFLKDSLPNWPSTHAADRYALGCFESDPLVERHSVAANRGWLPLASDSSISTASTSRATSHSGGPREFLLEHPNPPNHCIPEFPGALCGPEQPESALKGFSSEQASSFTVEVETVGLEDLKRKIAAQIADPGLVERLRQEEARNNMTALMSVYDLTASASNNSVTLRWIEPGSAVEFVSGFRILRRDLSETVFVTLADVPSENEDRNCAACPAMYVDSDGIEADTEYVYVVRALTTNSNNGTDVQVEVTTTEPLDTAPTPTR